MIKSFCIKNKYPILTVLLSIFFICCSYCFGCFNSSTRIDSELLNIHNISLADDSSSFIHAEFKNSEQRLVGKTVVEYISRTNGTDTSRKLLNPYCYLSENGEKRFFDAECNAIMFDNLSVSGIYLYSDSEMMQNIALPLYRTDGQIYMMTRGRNGADSGCYIPSSLAEKLVESIPDVNNFDELIDKGQTIKLLSETTLQRSVFSINNIYFDTDSGYWDPGKKNAYQSDYANYNLHFSAFNPITLFVAINDVFPNEQTIFCCDLKDGYGSLSIFTNNVTSFNYSNDGYSLSFALDSERQIYSSLDEFAYGRPFTNAPVAIVFLILSILSGTTVLFLFYQTVHYLYPLKKGFILFGILLGIIMLFWILPYFISIFGISAKFMTYLILNKIGNQMLIFYCLFLICEFSILVVKQKW